MHYLGRYFAYLTLPGADLLLCARYVPGKYLPPDDAESYQPPYAFLPSLAYLSTYGGYLSTLPIPFSSSSTATPRGQYSKRRYDLAQKITNHHYIYLCLSPPVQFRLPGRAPRNFLRFPRTYKYLPTLPPSGCYSPKIFALSLPLAPRAARDYLTCSQKRTEPKEPSALTNNPTPTPHPTPHPCDPIYILIFSHLA